MPPERVRGAAEEDTTRRRAGIESPAQGDNTVDENKLGESANKGLRVRGATEEARP
jgi:hypothetical protein